MSLKNHGEMSHSGDRSSIQKIQKEVKPRNVIKDEAEESWQQIRWKTQKIRNEYIMEKIKTYNNEYEEILAKYKKIWKKVEKEYNLKLDIHAECNTSPRAIEAYTELNNRFKKYLDQRGKGTNAGELENIEMVEALRKDQYTSEQWIMKFYESQLANNIRVKPEEGKTLFEDQAKINELNLETAKELDKLLQPAHQQERDHPDARVDYKQAIRDFQEAKDQIDLRNVMKKLANVYNPIFDHFKEKDIYKINNQWQEYMSKFEKFLEYSSKQFKTFLDEKYLYTACKIVEELACTNKSFLTLLNKYVFIGPNMNLENIDINSKLENIKRRYSDYGRELSGTATQEKNKPNEDAYFANDEQRVYAVFDGVTGKEGGSGGHLASAIAVDYLKQSLPRLSDKLSVEEIKQEMSSILKNLNDKIVEHQIENYSEMATTASIVKVMKDGTAVIGNVGDSRVYLRRSGESSVEQLTLDHAGWVEEVKNEGYDPWKVQQAMAEAENPRVPSDQIPEIATDRLYHGITQCLGKKYIEGQPQTELKISISTCPLKHGDMLITTSDGVHDNLTDKQIAECLLQYKHNPKEAALALVQLAKDISTSTQKTPRSKIDDTTAAVYVHGEDRNNSQTSDKGKESNRRSESSMSGGELENLKERGLLEQHASTSGRQTDQNLTGMSTSETSHQADTASISVDQTEHGGIEAGSTATQYRADVPSTSGSHTGTEVSTLRPQGSEGSQGIQSEQLNHEVSQEQPREDRSPEIQEVPSSPQTTGRGQGSELGQEKGQTNERIRRSDITQSTKHSDVGKPRQERSSRGRRWSGLSSLLRSLSRPREIWPFLAKREKIKKYTEKLDINKKSREGAINGVEKISINIERMNVRKKGFIKEIASATTGYHDPNEDSCFISEYGFGVFDGVSQGRHGVEASQMAKKFFEQKLPELSGKIKREKLSPEQIEVELMETTFRANNEINNKINTHIDQEENKALTTLSVVIPIGDREMMAVYGGDTRVYVLTKDGELKHKTTDDGPFENSNYYNESNRESYMLTPELYKMMKGEKPNRKEQKRIQKELAKMDNNNIKEIKSKIESEREAIEEKEKAIEEKYRSSELLINFDNDEGFDTWFKLNEKKKNEVDENMQKAINNMLEYKSLEEMKLEFVIKCGHVVGQYLGSGEIKPNIAKFGVNPGDRVIITSDGVHDNLMDQEIVDCISKSETAEEAARALVKTARERSLDHTCSRRKPDDTTVVVVECSGDGGNNVQVSDKGKA